MAMSWEQYTAMEEAANMDACQGHAATFGILEDTEDFMEKHNLDGCEQMPCRVGCPLMPDREPCRHSRAYTATDPEDGVVWYCPDCGAEQPV